MGWKWQQRLRTICRTSLRTASAVDFDRIASTPGRSGGYPTGLRSANLGATRLVAVIAARRREEVCSGQQRVVALQRRRPRVDRLRPPEVEAGFALDLVLGLLRLVRAQLFAFFFQAEDGIRDHCVTGVQTCALPI